MTIHMDPFAPLQQRISRRHFALHLLAIAVATHAALSQDLVAQDSPTPETKGVRYFAPRTLDFQFGMKFKSNDNFCSNLFATIAFPTDWPEQKVKLKLSNIPPNSQWQFRDLPPNAPTTARQMMMSLPGLQPNNQLDMVFDVEVEAQ
jgi:hypothetical protein